MAGHDIAGALGERRFLKFVCQAPRFFVLHLGIKSFGPIALAESL